MRLDDYGIDGLRRSFGQVRMIGQHYDGELRFNALDLGGDDCAIQQAQTILQHNGIHRPQHQKAQALGTIGRANQFVSIFLQRNQLGWNPVDAKQSAVGSRAG